MQALPDTVFQITSTVAAMAWMALALSPPGARWTRTVWRLTGRVLPLAFAVVYIALMVANRGAEGGFGSIAQVQQLFAVPGLLAAGWIHYLAFDLFVGTWIAERSAALRIPHAFVLPLLVLTFLFGPAGLVGFLLVRAWRRPDSLRFREGSPA
jgi:Domain of unknown function (DUF4281)